MIHFHLAQLDESSEERYWGASSTLVFVEGYRGSLIEEGEWLALQLADVFLLQWPETLMHSGLEEHHIFKCPPPQKILPGIKSILIGTGEIFWWSDTSQSYGRGARRLFNHLVFPEHTFEESLSRNIGYIKRLSNAIYVTKEATE